MEENLTSVLSKTEGRPLVVISVAGDARKGKSFLMNYIIRALEAMETEETDWMDWQNSHKELVGFSWNHGYNPVTSGIWMWSRPFLVDTEEDAVAVLLLDTQGFNPDNPEETKALLSLSLLTSSVTVLNCSDDLSEDTLKMLTPYLKYGMTYNENTEKGEDPPFQSLYFLIRDWSDPNTFPYGFKGGRQFWEQKQRPEKELKGKAARVRKQMMDAFPKCFQHVDCCLTPNIGEDAITPPFKGGPAGLSPEFAKNLETFINEVVSSEGLPTKKLFGDNLTHQDFFRLMTAYVSIINEASSPDSDIADHIWNTTAHHHHQVIMEKAMEKYDDALRKKLIKQAYLLPEDLQLVHNQAGKQARKYFEKAKTIDDFEDEYGSKLQKMLGDALNSVIQRNGEMRESYIAGCIAEVVTQFKDLMATEFPFQTAPREDNLHNFFEDAQIQKVANKLKQNYVANIKLHFSMEPLENLEPLIETMLQKLDHILNEVLEENFKYRNQASDWLTSKVDQLTNEVYNLRINTFLEDNPHSEVAIFGTMHKVAKGDTLKEFDKVAHIPGPPQFPLGFKATLESSLDTLHSNMQFRLSSINLTMTTEGQKLMNSAVEEHLSFLEEAASPQKMVTEDELTVEHQRRQGDLLVKFTEDSPFQDGSPQQDKLSLELKTKLDRSFDNALEVIRGRREARDAFFNASKKAFELYEEKMKEVLEEFDFIEENEFEAEHHKRATEAMTGFQEDTRGHANLIEDAPRFEAELKTKIVNLSDDFRNENMRKSRLAKSEADQALVHSRKQYQAAMKTPVHNCTTLEDFEACHDTSLENAVTSLEEKLGENVPPKFVGDYISALKDELAEAYKEMEELFTLKRQDEQIGTKLALEKARKVYSREMKTLMKNADFVQPCHLNSWHTKAEIAALQVAEAETPLNDRQKDELKASLQKTFQRFKDKNDMALNFSASGEPAIGIDLGTTYCCVAVYVNGQVKIIPNELGARTTPSYVTFENDGTFKIGQPAKDNAYRNPEFTVFDAKRMIGRKFDDRNLQEDMKYWPFTVVPGGEGIPAVDIRGEQVIPEKVASILLNHLKKQAERFIGKPVKKAVITVPAYFNDGQRQATRDAGELAGLEVLTILNEPTAAAIAYKMERIKEDARKVLIFDFGGGTFDVAILEMTEGEVKVLGVDGDTHLGGEDFDKNMMTYCAQQFGRQRGIDLFSDKDSPVKVKRDEARKRLRRLQTECEKGKKELAAAFATDICLDGFFEGTDLRVNVERRVFEGQNHSHFRKAIDLVQRALGVARVRKEEIDDIVLIGGSTRIPKVQEMLSEYFNGKALTYSINPDEAVAYGAAIQAAILNGGEARKLLNLKSIDVTPMTLGVEAIIDGVEGAFSTIIPRNTAIPSIFREKYYTNRDNQSNAAIRIYQGEKAAAKENNLLGEFVLEGIPPAKAGKEGVEVVMEVDAMGILHVKAICLSTGLSSGITVTEKKGRLSEEAKRKLIQDASKSAPPRVFNRGWAEVRPSSSGTTTGVVHPFFKMYKK